MDSVEVHEVEEDEKESKMIQVTESKTDPTSPGVESILSTAETLMAVRENVLRNTSPVGEQAMNMNNPQTDSPVNNPSGSPSGTNRTTSENKDISKPDEDRIMCDVEDGSSESFKAVEKLFQASTEKLLTKNSSGDQDLLKNRDVPVQNMHDEHVGLHGGAKTVEGLCR